MKIYVVALFGISCIQVPAYAQDADSLVSSGSSENTFTLNASFEPTFGSDLVEERGQRLNDAVATSKMGFKYSINPDGPITVTLAGGAKWKSDFEDDDDDSSGLVGVAKVSWNRGCRTINPFASFSGEHGYTGFFDDQADDIGTWAVGADIVFFDRNKCTHGLEPEEIRRLSSFVLSITPSVERIESSDEANERWAGRIRVEGSKTIVDRIKLTGNFDYQFRKFDTVESGSDRHHYFNGGVGLNFAELLFGTKSLVDNFALGASWEVVDVENTGLLQDQSEISFTPKISISHTF